MPNLATKNVLFGYFWARIKKTTVVIFEIGTVEFVESEFLTQTVNL